MREGATPRVTVADRPYGEFYDFYSVSPENFGYHLVHPLFSVEAARLYTLTSTSNLPLAAQI
jgi:hypothetical protein